MHVLYFFLGFIAISLVIGLLVAFFQSKAGEYLLMGGCLLLVASIFLLGILLIVGAFITDNIGEAIGGVVVLTFGFFIIVGFKDGW